MSGTSEILLAARQRISKTTHKMVNEKTGCYGLTVQDTPDSRANITIHHGVRCNCLDVHLLHLHQQAQVAYKQNNVKRGRRDDLIVAVKLRLPNIGLADIGLTVKIPQPRKKVSPEEAGSHPLRVVEELSSGQLLIEEWDSVEAWQNRKIWKDW
ncbi:hypothetical protein F4820DRAFT_330838 [Hypoxylon rubiginosum]|uniref:Uncharacterized protein n=1 Tax=Hypoxylon rubiginosum TaxID=110542 RepID=A0ACB9YZU6_9PEZI|nr:hypothetical protein F4820DRAFT_330838 [Hypoxylon rubiginosum]